MKKYFVLPLFLVLLISSCARSQFKWTEDTFILAGKVENLASHPGDSTLRLEYYQLASNRFIINEEVRLDKDGNFFRKMHILQPQAMFLKYGTTFNLLITPGDSIFIRINAAILDDSLRRYNAEKYIQFGGGSLAQDNVLMNMFIKGFYRIYNKREIKSAGQESSPEKFTEFLNTLADSCASYYTYFCNATHPSERIKTWAQDHIRYSVLEDRMNYRTYHTRKGGSAPDTTTIPRSYYNFLKAYNPEDFSMLSVPHIHFLHEYLLNCMLAPMADPTLMKVQLKEKDFIQVIKTRISMLRSNASGTTRDLFLARYLQGLIGEKELALFDSVYVPGIVYDTLLDAQVKQRRQEMHDTIMKRELNPGIKLFPVNSFSSEGFLDSLSNRYKGQAIFIGIWTPWCGKCLPEMQAARFLQRQYKDDEVRFVFLASQCREDAWKAYISLGVQGDHYLLSDAQYKALVKKLQLTSLPRFMLLDKDGKLVNPNAPKPSQMQEISKEMNQLLGKISEVGTPFK